MKFEQPENVQPLLPIDPVRSVQRERRGWRNRLLLNRLMRRMALRDWLSLMVTLALLALALGWQNGLGRLDQSLYDKFLSSIEQPRRDDIILIAIDDFSLQQLGRWPWPRSVHAQLIDRLTQAKPRAVGLDVILMEAEGSAANGAEIRRGDAALRTALLKNAATVLPVVITNPGTGLAAGLPIPALASAARMLGHINLEHDSDGVVRSVFLHEGMHGQWWPYFGLAVAQAGAPAGAQAGAPAGAASDVAAAQVPTQTAIVAPAVAASDAAAHVWQRTDQR